MSNGENRFVPPRDLPRDLWRLCSAYHSEICGLAFRKDEATGLSFANPDKPPEGSLAEFALKAARQVGYLRDGGPEL